MTSGPGTTLFLTELAVNDVIMNAAGTVIGTVKSITSNTALVLTANAAVNVANAAYTAQKVPAATDTVNVGTTAAHTVTVPAATAVTAAVLTIGNAGVNGPAALTLAANTSQLTVTGNTAINRPNNNNTNALNANAGTANLNGTLTITGGPGNRVARLAISTGTVSVAGNIGFAGAAGNARIVFTGAGTLNVGAALGAGGTLTPGTGTVAYNGTAAQNVGTYPYNNLTVDKANGTTATLTAATLVGGNLTVNAGTLDLATFTANRTLTGGAITIADGATLKIGGTNSFPANYTTHTLGPTSTVEYSGTNQSVAAEAAPGYGHLTLSGSGTKTAAGSFTVRGDLSISGVTFASAATTQTVNGNLSNTGTQTITTGRITLSGGSAAHTLSGTGTYASLELNDAQGATLNADATLSTTLRLTAGVFATGANSLITSASCAAAATVIRTSGWVNGNLRKNIPAGASNCTFEIGDATNYTPVTLAFAAGTTAGNLTARATPGDHPSLATSSLDPNFTVNRYWTLTNAGVGFTTFSATFTFVLGDVDTDTNTANVLIQRFAAGTWNTTTIGTRTATTTQATGLNAVGDFQIGEGRPATGASSFNAVEVAADAVAGVIKTKVAGVAFNLDLVALNAARDALNTGFRGPVTVELLNASNNSAALDGNGCRSSWAVIQGFSVVFAGADNGRRTTAFTEANSWPEARVRVKYTIAGTDVLIGCSTDNFAIRPATFAGFSASDADWASAGTTRALTNTAVTGGVVHKAGQPFTLSATAVNGAATPATMAAYSGSPVVVVVSTVEPASGALGTVTPGTWSAAAGVITTTTASYSEAGVISMRLEDQGFALVDAADGSTTAERYIVGPAVNVGRFVPDHFAFTSPSTPQLRTFDATCAGARSFTYVGQPFWYATLPSATIEARNAAGGVTTNYRGTLFKLAPSGFTETYSGNGVGPTLNVGSAVSPPQLSTGNGTGTYTAAASAANVNLSFARSATTPVAPFTANISLTVSASDGSESGPPGNGTIGSTSSLTFNGSGSGIAFDSGAAFRYGYVGLTDVFGPLGGNVSGNAPVAIEARYWSGTAFDLNTADNCSTFSNANFLLFAHAGDVNTTNLPPATKVSLEGGSPLALTAGRAVVNVLSPTPALAKPGSAKLCLDLDAAASQTDGDCIASSPANKAYLQGRWRGTSYNKDPEARVGFGLFGSQPRNFIFFRENY